MSRDATFVERALHGDVLDPDAEVSATVEAWHRSETPKSLHDWLGMTEGEYALFAGQPEMLSAILMARRYGIDLTQLVDAKEARLRERSDERLLGLGLAKAVL